MSIDGDEDLDGLRAVGTVVRRALAEMEGNVRPGTTTAELNRIGAEVLRQNGARSAPMVFYGFPAEICISVNDEIVHGIPSARVVEEGDLVKLDVTAVKDGYVADAAITVAVGSVSEEKKRFVECARRAFHLASRVARAGQPLNRIGREVEREVGRDGFAVVRQLTGHGVGKAIHESPEVPNYYDPEIRERLTNGLVITIEPIISMGSGLAVEAGDGWTLLTADRSDAAHYEHTIVVTDGEPIVVTAAE